MTLYQAKKDLAGRLQVIGVPFGNIKGKVVGFADLGRGEAIFLSIQGVDFQALMLEPGKLEAWREVRESKGKGYIIN